MGKTVCVLAVSGYGDVDDDNDAGEEGEELDIDSSFDEKKRKALLRDKVLDDNPSAMIRGDRPWRDGGGGATICCSLCCAQLGFVSSGEDTTFRFLKHRLLTKNGNHQLSSCASFIAREMAKYADVKAIFTFVIFRGQKKYQDKEEDKGEDKDIYKFNKNNLHHGNRRRKCLLLRLVSWDSRMATSFGHNDDDHITPIFKFRQVAKIVFEETYEKVIQPKATESGDNTKNDDDPTKWVWGGVDLCCPPDDDKNDDAIGASSSSYMGGNSSVRLHLPPDEYDEALRSFKEGTKLISKDVADATIMVKMGIGMKRDQMLNLGLAAIPLDE